MQNCKIITEPIVARSGLFLKECYKNTNSDCFSIKMTDSMSFSDFKCSDKQFTCKNGVCVKKNMQCDGNYACKDKSDEDDCECPSNKFSCQQGGCFLPTAVCNGENDCSNGDDEKNCRK